MDQFDECALIGAAILSAQKFEFAFYGIVSNLSHLPEAQKEKRFRELTPEKFLRGSLEDTRATLGQLEKIFGDRLLISTSDLKRFIEDRNLIAHNYWRLTKANIKGGKSLNDPEIFLKNFLVRCDKWSSIIRGLLCVMRQAAAEKENRLSEISFNEQELSDIVAYKSQASTHHSVPKR